MAGFDVEEIVVAAGIGFGFGLEPGVLIGEGDLGVCHDALRGVANGAQDFGCFELAEERSTEKCR